MPKAIEPLPCPFCGAAAETELWHGGAKTKTHVGCSDDTCEAHPGLCAGTRAAAVRIWNRRAEMPRLRPRTRAQEMHRRGS